MRFTEFQYSQPYPSRYNYSRLACVLSPDGQYESQATCSSQTQCGWKYKCVDQSCILAPDGTFDTQDSCFATCSRWACQVPLTVTGEAGSKPLQQYTNGLMCANNFPCAVVTYFPMVTFVAYKPMASINVSNEGMVGIQGGSGNDYTMARYVLIRFGNQQQGLSDLPAKPEILSNNGENIPLNVVIVAAGNWRNISGRDRQYVPGLNPAQKIKLDVGYQYQLCYQLISKCNDSMEVGWPASQVTLSDA